MKTKDLIFDDKNANKHTERGLELLHQSVQEFGMGRSILIDKNNRIIGGNGIIETCNKLGIDDVQVVESDGTKIIAVKRTDIDLDTKKGRGLALADNATNAADLEWNKEVLQTYKDDFGVDASDWGVDVWEETEESEARESDTNEEVEKMLNECTRHIADDLTKQFDKLQGFSFITPNTAKFDFIRFAYYGKEYPRYNSLAFHQKQFITAGDNFSTYEGLKKVANGSAKSERLRFATGDKWKSLISGSLAFAGAKMPLDFPAELARNLMNEFASGGKVLDPCAGWGGEWSAFSQATQRSTMAQMQVLTNAKECKRFTKHSRVLHLTKRGRKSLAHHLKRENCQATHSTWQSLHRHTSTERNILVANKAEIRTRTMQIGEIISMQFLSEKYMMRLKKTQSFVCKSEVNYILCLKMER